MSGFEIGNIVGRLLMSALIVYVILLLLKKFQFGVAFRGLKRPLPVISIIIIFLLGLAGSAQAASDRAQRPFDATEFPGAGLIVYVPSRPEWNVETEQKHNAKTIRLSTPEKYYPPAVIEITLLKKLRVGKKEFADVAVSTLNTGRANSGVITTISFSDLKQEVYGNIEAYSTQYDIRAGGQTYSMKSLLGLMPNGKPILLSILTTKGQIADIEHMANKIWSNIKELSPQK